MAIGVGRNVFRCAHAHHSTATGPTFGSHVNQPVGGFDDVQVVLDHHNRVAGIAQLVQHFEQQINVGKVQASGRLVQNVQSAAGVFFAQL